MILRGGNMKCNYCDRKATRLHGRHDTEILEYLCEIHYFVWNPTNANLEKIRLNNHELIEVIKEYNRIRRVTNLAKPKTIAEELECVADLLGQCLETAEGEAYNRIREAVHRIDALIVVV